MALIQLQSVSRHYHLGETTVEALKNIDLTIDKGEFVAVWGPSGSGKSTLCNLIGVVDLPTHGHITINDRDVRDMSDNVQSDHRNRSVGFIFQGFNLVSVLTAVENVMLPLALRGEHARTARRKATDLLAELGLEQYADHRPDKMSGGQRQRVAIARALVTEPPIVVADEPTANLDTENADHIVGLMKKVNRTHGTTFIFSTHDQRLLDQVSRRIRLQDGTIVSDSREAQE